MRLNVLSRPFDDRAACDESGSLVVVVVLMIVVAMLSVALVTRVRGDFDNANFETYMEQARASAQSGVADALFRIDQLDGMAGNFCNAPLAVTTPKTCPMTSVPSAPAAQYTVTYNSSTTTYTILSRSTVHGVKYALKAVVGASPVINSAVSGSTMTFDGSTFRSIDVTGANGLVIAGKTANISVASYGNLTCHGNPGGSVDFIEYLHSSTNCTPQQTINSTYQPQQPSLTCPPPPNPEIQPPTPCVLSTAQSCSSMSGQVTGNDTIGYTITGPATLEPGVYLCYGGLTTSGSINVDYAQSPLQNSGRVEIYVFGPKQHPLTSTTLTLGGTLNACEVGTPSGTPASNCVSGSNQIVGDPADLQIYDYGTGNVELGGLTSANALLWAPGMTIDTHGAADNLTWTGAIVIGTVDAHGSPASFLVNYDERLATEYQDTVWNITSYLPTSSGFSIPNY